MKIELNHIPIREVVAGYENKDEDGVVGYGGKLDIRPAYQREFVYKDHQQTAVIDTILKDFPLNVMYWVKNEEDSYEVLDGQQRTLSICEFWNNNFAVNINGNPQYFHSLPEDIREKFLDYKLMIYVCEGTDSEKIEWFKTINIAGEKLTNQELLNAVYTGPWLSDAKKLFSKNNCVAYRKGKDYIKAVTIRQELLETALNWISGNTIEKYMATHRNDTDANELWTYFQEVIDWVERLFPKSEYRSQMQGLPWGELYNEYKDQKFNSNTLKQEVDKLMADEEVQKKSGIYQYIITGKEKHLNLRAFQDSVRTTAFEQQKGVCPACSQTFKIEEMEADHITPWHAGGKTTLDNCQMLCKDCNRRKSGK